MRSALIFLPGRTALSPLFEKNKRAQRIEISAPSLSLRERVIKSKKIGLGVSPALKMDFRHCSLLFCAH